jgi:hypothetical protein
VAELQGQPAVDEAELVAVEVGGAELTRPFGESARKKMPRLYMLSDQNPPRRRSTGGSACSSKIIT